MATFRRQLQSTPPSPGSVGPRALWLSFERHHHRIMVRTVAGGANYVAHKIDTAGSPDILGTVAGNDSVIVICADSEAAVELTARLSGILSPTPGL